LALLNQQEVRKTTIKAKLLSGTYILETHIRLWGGEPSWKLCSGATETRLHILDSIRKLHCEKINLMLKEYDLATVCNTCHPDHHYN
jgi:hypothetical protein